MKIFYENKKTLSEIIELTKNVKKIDLNIFKNDNIFIEGDNFTVMSNLLDFYSNKIDLIYIDPPYNTMSDFMYSENKISTVSFSQEDSILAYKDKMSLDDYLEFIRERLVLIYLLLSDRGTLYFHIDIKIGHYIKILLDEIFGKENFVNDITRVKSNPKNFSRRAYGNQKDVIYIYSKKIRNNIFNDVKIHLDEKEKIKLFPKIDENGKRYTTVPCHAPGETLCGETGKQWKGEFPPKGRHWRYSVDELDKLDSLGLIEWSKNKVPRIKKYLDEHEGKKIQDIWLDYKDPQYPIYPTEKNRQMLEMIVEQSSYEDSIILDCFCGAGTFLKAGLSKNRKVIGIDKSPIATKVILENEELKNNLKFIKFDDVKSCEYIQKQFCF